jgi:hypothetical protein
MKDADNVTHKKTKAKYFIAGAIFAFVVSALVFI